MEILTLKNIISYLFIGFIVLFSISMLVAFFVKLTRAGKNAPKALNKGINDIQIYNSTSCHNFNWGSGRGSGDDFLMNNPMNCDIPGNRYYSPSYNWKSNKD